MPTIRAKELHAELLPSLRAIADAIRKSKGFVPAEATRTFHIRSATGQSAALMPALLAKVRQEAPDVKVMVNVAHSNDCVSLSQDSNEFDLLLAPSGYDAYLKYRHHDFAPVPFVCLFDGKRLGIDAPISREQYAALPHLSPPVGYLGRGTLESDLQRAGIQRQRMIMTNEFGAFPIYLKSMDAIATVPRGAAVALARHFGLTLSPLPVAEIQPYRISLYWHARHDTDPGHTWLRELLVSTMEEIDRASERRIQSPVFQNG